MSDQFNLLLAQLISQARIDGIDSNAIMAAVQAALGVPEESGIWSAEGITMPDADGFIRFKALEDFKSQLIAAGHQDVASTIMPRYACTPGLSQLLRGSDLWQAVITDMSWAGFTMMAVGIAGRCFKFQTVQTDFGSHLVQVPSGKLDQPYILYPDATAIPENMKTVNDCVGYIKAHIADLMTGQPSPPGVDFSPAKP